MKRETLTPRQKRFCQARAEGRTLEAAYTEAGYSSRQSKKARTDNAFKLENTEKIQREIQRLQSLADRGAILSREQRAALLSAFALNVDGETGKKDRLRALDILARMHGDYSETLRAEVSASVETDRDSAVSEALARLLE